MKIYTSVRLRRGWPLKWRGEQKKQYSPLGQRGCLTQTVLVVWCETWLAIVMSLFPLGGGSGCSEEEISGLVWGLNESATTTVRLWTLLEAVLLSEDRGKESPLLNSENDSSGRSDCCQSKPTFPISLSPTVLLIQVLSSLTSAIIIQMYSHKWTVLGRKNTWLELS